MTQNQQFITLETDLGEDKLILTSFTGEETLSQLFSYKLQAFSEDFSIDEKNIVGKSVTVKINPQSSNARIFHGLVKTFIKKSVMFREIREYELEVVPWFWLLSLSQDCCIFQNQSTIEIAEKIFKKFNLSDYNTGSLTRQYKPREYCVQYNETAFNFISRLFEEEGIFYFFKHEEGKHTLMLVDLITSCPDNQTPTVNPSLQAAGAMQLTSWAQTYSLVTGQWSHSDYDFTKPTASLLSNTKAAGGFSKTSNLEIFEFPGDYQDQSTGQNKSRIRMEEQETDQNFIMGAGTYYTFCPGTKFQLKANQSSQEEGKYCIVSVSHFAQDKSHKLYRPLTNPHEDTTATYENQFTCIPTSVHFRPRRTIEKPKTNGPQTAIVTGPSNEEIYTDQYGRIKVQFFWDRYGKHDEKSSCWLRVMYPWTGNNWGNIFIPRVGQEVVVTFIDNDPDRPLAVGCLYNQSNMVPYTLPDNKTQSGIKFCSTPKGSPSNSNELRFEDKKGEEQVFLHAQKDFMRVVENDETQNINHDQIVTIKNNRTHTITEGDDSLTIKKGKLTVSIQGDHRVTVSQGNQTTELKMGNYALNIQQGNHSVKVSLGQSTLEAIQGIELKVGGNSIKIDQTGITLQGMMIKINGQMIQTQADALLQLKGAITMIN
ncbi:MAG: type VI secretion system tip protein VgrG [Alphaproteobacteria bacterium]|nr:type VI secretion system tip protein VgrG [Alphaproteobacteria bacterium]